MTLSFGKGPEPYTLWPGYKTRSIGLHFDRLGGDSIWSGTDVSADSILLSLLSFAIDLTSSLSLSDFGESTFFLPEIEVDVALFSSWSSSNSKESAKRRSSEFSHSASANSYELTSDLSYNKHSSISISRVLWIFQVKG